MIFSTLSRWFTNRATSRQALLERARRRARRFYQHGYMREEVEALQRETQTMRRIK